ncbi:uncharacterized protein BJ212DRAFT_1486166 [Suillus subaureus]|uniref:Uncharacterized protein n=1 Tax=Suillus subaureus TaxID=48587 RepID=A0A9P7DXL2_9AGAM|nr:uncharacterized protein BJ212DRAFT_1486166 [Suillus subaureus]KAG1805821.1 hypothetical protein BJ212DRAFT_1486166 [Suillus subaureus]
MAPPTIYSAEQIEFMETYHDQFLECKVNKNYQSFWSLFFEAWETKFPERAVVFKDIPLDVNLTDEQSAEVATVWTLRQQMASMCTLNHQPPNRKQTPLLDTLNTNPPRCLVDAGASAWVQAPHLPPEQPLQPTDSIPAKQPEPQPRKTQ